MLNPNMTQTEMVADFKKKFGALKTKQKED